jgi:hypothetical protein
MHLSTRHLFTNKQHRILPIFHKIKVILKSGPAAGITEKSRKGDAYRAIRPILIIVIIIFLIYSGPPARSETRFGSVCISAFACMDGF